jgi:hypothetical protein
MKELAFKEKIGDVWMPVSVEHVAGKTLRECFEQWDGREVICKVDQGFICGTAEWIEHYKRKGFKTISFPDTIATLESRGERATLAHVIIPLATKSLSDLFGPAKVISTSLTDDTGSAPVKAKKVYKRGGS